VMLFTPSNQRKARHDLWLGASTAVAAGLVNVCSVVAFFAFSSNVTGHVAIFAEEVVKGHWHQVTVVLLWMFMFLAGAFVAHLMATVRGARNSALGHAVPMVLEVLILVGVGYYGHHHYAETLKETEYLVAALVFAMGLQNGLVATVSNGIVKTTHLTGLFTDLGMELSMVLQPQFRSNETLHFKLKLHLLILLGYVCGGFAGGFLFVRFGFQAIYMASFLLGLILVHDCIVMWLAQRQNDWRWTRETSLEWLRKGDAEE
jgi:uncharacterized membrane protein YoaK (UPF0700 family)